MLGHFQMLIAAIVKNPEYQLSQFSHLSHAEQHQVIVEWNDTTTSFPDSECIHSLCEAQVERSPDAIAVVFEDEQITYRELNRRANQLAHHLKKLGVGPERLVGICVERSPALIVGLLGILKSGGAYLPLDPAYPQERLVFILEDARAAVLITEQRHRDKLPSFRGDVVCLDRDGTAIGESAEENPISDVTAENLAYVLYTSGSTGKPKGAMIGHHSIVTYTRIASREFVLGVQDRVLQFASICFDTAGEEIFPCLAQGAALVLRSDSMMHSIPVFLQHCQALGLTVLDFPTAYWHQFVSELSATPSALPKALKLVVIAGERALPEHVSKWIKLAGQSIRLLNTYGLTETTIVATMCTLDKSVEDDPAAWREVPIGHPIPNTQTYVLSRQLNPVAIGISGELCVGGTCLARGYSNRPDLTAMRFVPDLFGVEPGPRLYRTGDLVRYRTDGMIEYLDRIDHQVKVRGFRIELGEIETVLSQHPAAQETVVVVREDVPGEKRLVAYLVTEGTTKPSISELRSFLAGKIPDYMVPTAFVMLESLPLSPNGKVDRRALPAPNQNRPELDRALVVPRTPVEETLARIWTQVLRVDRVGVHDNFFELGGDSILVIQIIARASQAGLRVTPKQIFENPTIAALTGVIDVTPQIAAEPSEVTGPVPLTPIQQWFFEQDLREYHHWNQTALLRMPQALHPALVEKGLQHLLMHHDALRLRFVRQGAIWQQAHRDVDNSISFRFVDLSALSGAQHRSVIEAEANRLHASLDLEKGPLVQVAYFDLGPDDPARLLWVIHHLIVDGVSSRILLEDFQTAVTQMSGGKAIQLSRKTTAFKQWAENLHSLARDDKLNTQLQYWLNLQKTLISSLPVDFPAATTVNREASSRTVTISTRRRTHRSVVARSAEGIPYTDKRGLAHGTRSKLRKHGPVKGGC